MWFLARVHFQLSSFHPGLLQVFLWLPDPIRMNHYQSFWLCLFCRIGQRDGGSLLSEFRVHYPKRWNEIHFDLMSLLRKAFRTILDIWSFGENALRDSMFTHVCLFHGRMGGALAKSKKFWLDRIWVSWQITTFPNPVMAIFIYFAFVQYYKWRNWFELCLLW